MTDIWVVDAHGAYLEKLKPFMEKYPGDIDRIWNLGDLDKTIFEMPDFEKYCAEAGIKLINLPGNHDLFIYKGINVESEELRKQKTTSAELHNEIKKNPEVWEYLKKIAESDSVVNFFLDEERFGKRYPVVAVHGALDGDLRIYSACPAERIGSFARMRTDENFEKNFEKMREKGVKIMIGGHEHPPRPFCVCQYTLDDNNAEDCGDNAKDTEQVQVKENRKVLYEFEPLLNRGGVRLFVEDELSVITLGAYKDGYIATIDTETDECPIMSFYRL